MFALPRIPGERVATEEEREMVHVRWRVAVVVVAGVLAALIAPRPGAAQISGPHVTLTPYVGGVNWDNKVNVNGSAVYGGRVGLMFGGYFGLEAAYDHTSSSTRNGPTFWFDPTSTAASDDATTNRLMLGAVANLLPRAKVCPFVSGG